MVLSQFITDMVQRGTFSQKNIQIFDCVHGCGKGTQARFAWAITLLFSFQVFWERAAATEPRRYLMCAGQQVPHKANSNSTHLREKLILCCFI